MSSQAKTPKLLIIGTSKDAHIDQVINHFPTSISYCRFNVDEYPIKSDLNFLSSKSKWELSFKTGDSFYDLTNVKTVWFRRIGSPTIDSKIEENAYRGFARGEIELVITSLAHLFEGAKWISPYNNTKRAASKLYQLKEAEKCGLKCPKTLVTNNPALAKDFIASLSKSIYKTLHSPSINYEDGRRSLIFTHLINKADERLLHQVRYAPCIFQEYVEKAYELRITLIGSRLFPVLIDSQSSTEGKFDWRAGLSENLKYEIACLPSEIEEKLLRFTNGIGLFYGAIDMIVTPKGEYIFLEINPHGAWGWLETVVEVPISKTLAEYLAECVANK